MNGNFTHTRPSTIKKCAGDIPLIVNITLKYQNGVGAIRPPKWIDDHRIIELNACHRIELSCATAGYKLAVQEHARKREQDRKSTRLNSSHVAISYAVFCLK